MCDAPELGPPLAQPVPTLGPPTFEYGRADTQYGLIFEHGPDGGVVITVPGTRFRYLRRRLAGVHNGPEGLLVALLFAGSKVLGRPTPPRAVIRLTWWGLRVTEPGPSLVQREDTRSWRLDQVGEVRPNRYTKGLYVRIPGSDNFDLLTDLPRDMVERIGRTLDEALARVRSAAASRPRQGADAGRPDEED